MLAILRILAVVTAGLALPASAHDLSANECAEGSDFILHAAQARDLGMSRDEFIGRMQSDIVLIQNFPPELRWFVQDEDDETLLVGHAQMVFDVPQLPQEHQSEFMQACMTKRGEQAAAAQMRAAQLRQNPLRQE